jgi:membrane peptidoglycan carboxypeptidase
LDSVVSRGWRAGARRDSRRPGNLVVRLVGIGVLLAVVVAEIQTSFIQSQMLGFLARRLTWTVETGESPRVVYPRYGPFDVRLGYTRIPEFQKRLEERGFRIARQSRFSSTLAAITRLGVSPPAHERPVAGLVIRGRDGTVLFDANVRRHRFERYEDIPPQIVSTILLMENRRLEGSADFVNPAVDWGRLGRAALLSAASLVGMPAHFQGGSTMAVQIEKYRHSKDGRTGSAGDKLQQIVAASLRAYREGPHTRDEQHAIVLDYLNTVPLGGAPGYGEVHGLGEGLRAWFGMDPDRAFKALSADDDDPAKARALKHTIALLCAVRAPTRMLRTNHAELERRVHFYVGSLAAHGVLDSTLAAQVDDEPIRFDEGGVPRVPLAQRKAVNQVRLQLPVLLGLKDLHELDGLDLEVETTYDAGLEEHALALLKSLGDPDTVNAHGLRGPRMLETGDPSKVWYSVLLCERGPGADMVSVVADNLNRPFDMISGMRMQLGSTAKLRTLAHYLEIVESLHDRWAGLPSAALAESASAARDPITRWAAEDMAAAPDQPADSLIAHALAREYSGNPGEAFFTGGGLHSFHNFEPEENGQYYSVREGLAKSVNLVFIRLMRDEVRWHEARLPYDPQAVLADSTNPDRQKLLARGSDQEALVMLRRAYRRFKGVPVDSLPEALLGHRTTARRYAMLYFAWHPAAPPESLAAFLATRDLPSDTLDADRLTRAYGGPQLTLRDYAYLLDCHPLDIWTSQALARDPSLDWYGVLAASEDARCESQQWLFEPRNRRAQDLRLRIEIEQDAFADMLPSWQHLGFPFDRLVPSYATAIGSSADRPDALAKLMGIVVNDGIQRPVVSIRCVRFAPGTPYETVFEPSVPPGRRVMSPAIAHALRAAMLDVVTEGTARRMAGAFDDSTHTGPVVGGKTGSGDNRYSTFAHGGRLIGSHAVNRTAVFAFYIGDRYYGVVTAVVDGPQADQYVFTSALPVQILRMFSPELKSRVMPRMAPKPEPGAIAARAN